MRVTRHVALCKTTISVDEEPCDYQKAGSCLVPGAVESDRDVTCYRYVSIYIVILFHY